MILSKRSYGTMFTLVLLMSMWSGVMMGVSADSAAEATIDVEQEIDQADIREPEADREAMYEGLGPVAPLAKWSERFSIDTPLDPYIRAGIYTITEQTLRAGLSVASVSGYVGYHYLRWVPNIIITGLAQLTMLAGVVYLLWDQVSTLRNLRETHG